MTKKTRTILFFALTILFLITTPVIILYSQGYRFDWASKKITQTGAFYFKATPARTNIFINGKFIKKTDFLFDSTLIGNLIPKSYFVRIEKEGYVPWTKMLAIEPKQVTEAKNILLFPKAVHFQTLFENVSAEWISPDHKTVLLQKTGNNKKWQLAIWNLATNDQHSIASQKTTEKIFQILWAPDSSKILIQFDKGETLQSVLFNAQGSKNDPCTQTPCDLSFLGTTTSVLFSSSNSDELIYLDDSQNLEKTNYLNLKSASTAFAKNVLAFSLDEKNILWLDSKGMLWRENLAGNSPALPVNKTPYPIQQETKYTIAQIGSALLIQEESGTLLKLTKQGAFEKILDKTQTLALSPDKKKIAILSNSAKISILYLENQAEQPSKKAGDLVSLAAFAKPVNDLLWINDHELIVATENSLKAFETDERDSPNIVLVAAYANPRAFWQDETKTLTVISEGKVYVSEKLIQ